MLAFASNPQATYGLSAGDLDLLGGLGLVAIDDMAVQELTEQDATDECVAFLALEPRLVRPGAIGDRLVVEEVLRLLGVRQGLPFRRLLRLLRLRRRCLCLRLGCVPDLDIVPADRLLAGFPDPLEIPVVRTSNP